MNYLIINGSPHKGNTWKLAETAKSALTACDSKCIFEEVHLIALNLPFCCGCSNCFRIGGAFCPHYSLISPVLEKMEQADGLILTTSTFNMRETALLKNFLDHLSYFLHRPHFFTKKALIITTVGAKGGNSTLKSLRGTLQGIGYNKCYGLSVSTASWNAYIPTGKVISKTEKLVNKFYNDLSASRLHCPSTWVLISYNLFRGMCINYAPGTEYETEDGIYWTEPERSRHIYDGLIPLRPGQKLTGIFFYLLGKILGKKLVVTYKKTK